MNPMQNQFKNKFTQLLNELSLVTDEPKFDIKGISDEDIAFIEKNLGFAIPQVYRDFLSVFGHHSNQNKDELWKHFCLYPDIITMVDDMVIETKEECNKDVVFPHNTLFVKRDLDDWAVLVYCDGNDDPLVSYYDYSIGKITEGYHNYTTNTFEPNPVTLSTFLLEFLISEVADRKLLVRQRPLKNLTEPSMSHPPKISSKKLSQTLTDIENDLSAYDNHWEFVSALLKHARMTCVLSRSARQFRRIFSKITIDEMQFFYRYCPDKGYNYALYRKIMKDYAQKHVIEDERVIAFFKKMKVKMPLNEHI